MNDITQPLRLAVGSHKAGSGAGCAMNVVSWESGDDTITDFPKVTAKPIAAIVQMVNDTYCSHLEILRPTVKAETVSGELFFSSKTTRLLCPKCSVEVLALAHRTVGTGTHVPDGTVRSQQIWIGTLLPMIINYSRSISYETSRVITPIFDYIRAYTNVEPVRLNGTKVMISGDDYNMSFLPMSMKSAYMEPMQFRTQSLSAALLDSARKLNKLLFLRNNPNAREERHFLYAVRYVLSAALSDPAEMKLCIQRGAAHLAKYNSFDKLVGRWSPTYRAQSFLINGLGSTDNYDFPVAEGEFIPMPGDKTLMELAGHVLDEFSRITGFKEAKPEPKIVTAAVAKMLARV